jgi:hypothetical protein
MISDALDQVPELALGPGKGLAAGISAAAAMLAFIAVLQTPLQLRITDVLAAIASIVPGATSTRAWLIVGALLHLGLGGLFGLLYGMCAQRSPARGLIAAGLLHGFVIWLISGWISHLQFAGGLKAIVHSRSWLVACLIYGLGLGGAAVLSERLRPADSFPLVLTD